MAKENLAARGVLASSIGVAVAALLALGSSLTERLDELAFDAEVSVLRLLRDPAKQPPGTPDVVLVGLDEASLDGLGVPMAMTHASLGSALEAIAAARPIAIGLDMSLPERSFDRFSPGLDRDLMRGLLAARTATALVVALDIDAGGRVRIPSTPLLAVAGGPEAFGLPLFPVDCDGVVRRFEPDPRRIAQRVQSRCGASGTLEAAQPLALATSGAEAGHGAEGTVAVPTFAARIAQRTGHAAALSQPGWIDATRGAPFSYIPLQDVVAWYRDGDRARLQAAFGDRLVLLGSVLPHIDRLRLPAALAAWEAASTPPPGLIINAQFLRNALGPGLVRAVPRPLLLALTALLSAIAFLARPKLRWLVFAGALLLGFALALALHAAGWFAAPGVALVAVSVAVAIRTALDLGHARREKERLVRNFGGYLSPQLLHAVLEDGVQAGATRREIALLFGDLRGFTKWSETADPALVLDTLNRYYTAITPLLHAHGGTIDNFRGDGVMVMFGAPGARADACDSAFAAARGMVAEIDRLNRRELAPRGIAAVEVTIGLAYGEVVFGDLGSEERKDFTALGDPVNVAARLQDLAKVLGYAILMTDAFARRLTRGQGQLRALGLHALKGHSPVGVVAWRAGGVC